MTFADAGTQQANFVWIADSLDQITKIKAVRELIADLPLDWDDLNPVDLVDAGGGRLAGGGPRSAARRRRLAAHAWPGLGIARGGMASGSTYCGDCRLVSRQRAAQRIPKASCYHPPLPASLRW